jgi:hypothetical protein
VTGRDGRRARPARKIFLQPVPPERRNFARIDGYRRIHRMVRGLPHLSFFHHAHRAPMRSHGTAQTRSIRHGVRLVRLPLALLLCAALGGCAGGMQSVYTSDFWVEPGKYEFLKCPDLAKQAVNLSQGEKTLMDRMERANQDVAGPLINAGVYEVQLKQTHANLELVQRTAREKGCPSTVPPAKK